MRTSKWKERMVAVVLALVIVMGADVVPANTNYATVEAASKDKEKPKFTFKGKTKMTVTKGKSVKIPKVTAKDNNDGDVTKKIKVTVKKGKKNYSSIAKKIKNNKSVKFTSTGKYTVTYTVTDKAGNKATKKRTITVEAPSKSNKETPTTEQSTTEEKIPTDADYVDYNYKTSTTEIDTTNATDDIKITFENDYKLYASVKSPALKDCSFIKYFGKITAKDAAGNDISDNIVIDISRVDDCIENYTSLAIYVTATDSNGNIGFKTVYVSFTEYFEMDKNAKKISSTTDFYGVLYEDMSYNDEINNNKAKKLEYKMC